MKKTLTSIRCVPRFGYDYTQVRSIDLEINDLHDEVEIARSVKRWFAIHGIADALYAIEVDDNGFFAVVNDEAFQQNWGAPIL